MLRSPTFEAPLRPKPTASIGMHALYAALYLSERFEVEERTTRSSMPSPLMSPVSSETPSLSPGFDEICIPSIK